jgi:predicted TIM-barrel fold metal-dependent hydrolase
VDDGLRRELVELADRTALVDTHEHLMSPKERAERELTVFYLFPAYALSDVVSAGLRPEDLAVVRDASVPLDLRWRLFSPYWERAKTTGYGRALLIAVRDLYGIDDISDDTYGELSQRIALVGGNEWYEEVLKRRANIVVSIEDQIPPPPFEPNGPATLDDRRFVAPVTTIDYFLFCRSRDEIAALESRLDRSLHTLDDYVKAIDEHMEREAADGVVALKLRIAYGRTIEFERVSRGEAEATWNRVRTYPFESSAPADARPVQDFLVRHFVRRSIDLGLPVQVHTGLQEGNGNVLVNSRPTLLVGLLLDYPEARFDLFHGAYPYGGELSAIVKNFRNASIDMCWLPIISPLAARRWLSEWLETVPHSKIFAFGGDYTFVEGAYAHAKIARRVVADVLAEKVAEDYLTADEARALLPRLLHDNAWEYFSLEQRWAARNRRAAPIEDARGPERVVAETSPPAAERSD